MFLVCIFHCICNLLTNSHTHTSHQELAAHDCNDCFISVDLTNTGIDRFFKSCLFLQALDLLFVLRHIQWIGECNLTAKWLECTRIHQQPYPLLCRNHIMVSACDTYIVIILDCRLLKFLLTFWTNCHFFLCSNCRLLCGWFCLGCFLCHLCFCCLYRIIFHWFFFLPK